MTSPTILSKILLLQSTLGFSLPDVYTPDTYPALLYYSDSGLVDLRSLLLKILFKKSPFKHRGKCLRQGFGKKYRWSFSGLEAVSGPALLKRKGL